MDKTARDLRSKPQIDLEDYLQKLETKDQTQEGWELPDPVPVAPPIGYKRQPTMVDHIRNMIRSEKLKQEAEAAGAETFEEADDFDVEEDAIPTSPHEWEDVFEPPTQPASPVSSDSPSGSPKAAATPPEGGEAAPASPEAPQAQPAATVRPKRPA